MIAPALGKSVHVVCLSEGAVPIAREAVRILSANPRQIEFLLVPAVVDPGPPELDDVYSWRQLGETLLRERLRYPGTYLFGIIDRPIEHNWFSRTIHMERICFVTTHSWEFLSHLPVAAFVAFEIAENLVEMLLGELRAHEDTRGCLHDLSAFKPHISYKMRTGDICPECTDLLRQRLETADVDAVLSILEEVRRAALGRSPLTPRTLAETVDREFPFPVAYCFRSMQAELTDSRKWLKLLELYSVIIRYLTFALLADAGPRMVTLPGARRRLSALRQPTGGNWHALCFWLLRSALEVQDSSFLRHFLNSVDERSVAQVQAISDRLNQLRNQTTGHGFVEGEAGYPKYYEACIGDIEVLLEFFGPLASYSLVKPGGLQRRHGVNTFSAKVLMGSHPLFPAQQHTTTQIVETDCVLYDVQEGAYLTLHPWLVFNTCSACFRDGIFLYDKITEDGVIIREYPSSHEQLRPDLSEDVRRVISTGA